MSFYQINNKLIGPANGFYVFEGSTPPEPPDPPTPVITTYSGITYETKGPFGVTLDPAMGTSKHLTATYIQISGGSWSGTFTSNPAGLSDCLGIYAPSAGTYSLIWENWRDYSANNSTGTQAFYYTGNMTKLLSLDFYGKRALCFGSLLYNEPITDIPQYAENIHNATNLTSVENMFNGKSTITGNLIPFITACIESCPNLTETHYALSGCINAADYNEATAQYPGWF